MPLTESGHVPTSTYRVQLHAGFSFADLSALKDYFSTLGISDLYLSPIFAAVPGSLHGYDVIDYGSVNSELGGDTGFRQLAAELRSVGCSIVLDFVPNHMGIAGTLNQWWREVLEHGPYSRFAGFFDIKWTSERDQGHPRVLVPMLTQHYGKALEQGLMTLVYDKEISVRYGETFLPLRPETYREILETLGSACEQAADREALRLVSSRFIETYRAPSSSGETKSTRQEDEAASPKAALRALMDSNPKLREFLEVQLAAFNGRVGEPKSFDRMDNILMAQHYRVARWQTATHEINYRRFFAIDSLIGLHMENPEVFQETHRLVGEYVASGDVRGLRIDHIDGLRQPQGYLNRVQMLTPREGTKPLYLLVEKILARDEMLPEGWPVHGTTGYEFISDMAGILIDRNQEPTFDQAYRGSTGAAIPYRELTRRAKRQIIEELFADAVGSLGDDLTDIITADRLWRDLTRHEVTSAIKELTVYLPVYRTYRRLSEPARQIDRVILEKACQEAILGNPRADPEPYKLLKDALTGSYPPADAPQERREAIINWILTYQQYTGAIMAKSVEDTAFYNYNRFIALNEVGTDPGVFGGYIQEFHRANLLRQAESPFSLLATSTHDTKMSEDIRCRLYSISELVPDWESLLPRWAKQSSRHVSSVDGMPAPDANDQYRFLQVLIGAWPLTIEAVDETFRNRLKAYFRKAVDEAKRHTSIVNNNEAYIEACSRFVDGVTSLESQGTVDESFLALAAKVARLGMINSLTQLVLKCTVPGIPDFYQGNEIWDFSLVDPDNRRAVDFILRQELARSLLGRQPADLLENWKDGGIKLNTTRVLLSLRAAVPEVFEKGSYLALNTSGRFKENVVAFLRSFGGESILVAVPRLSSQVGFPPLGDHWGDSLIQVSGGTEVWEDIFTDKIIESKGNLFARTLFSNFPFAVLRARRIRK